MRTKVLPAFFLVSILMLGSCVDEFWPELDKYENLLVVDGYISDEPGPYIITLSQSSPVDQARKKPLTGASVVIYDDQGNSEQLFESEPGNYFTSPDGIQGIPGRSYKIRIITEDGKIYESAFQQMITPTGIASVTAAIETQVRPDQSHDLAGYQFYLNTSAIISDTSYFLTRLEATYEYKADFLIRWVYNGSLEPFLNSDSLQTCWRTNKLPDFYTYTTLNHNEPVIENYPLNFVDTETRELSVRYSLLVKQFSIPEAAYTYWKNVKEQNSGQGGLYNTQPYQIKGNLVNNNDQNEPVLGYFMVAGVSQKRIFVDPPPLLFYYPTCKLTDTDYESFGTIFLSKPSEWPIYATRDVGGSSALPPQACMNCELYGGTIVKPDFWED